MVAVTASVSEVVAGNSAKVWSLDAVSGAVRRWDWVTEPTQAWGGVVDGAVSSLAFGSTVGATHEAASSPAASSNLFVGNALCLNVRSADGTYRRVGPDQGLPYGNLTALATSSRGGKGMLWVGTARGVALWQEDDQDGPWSGGEELTSWRYFYGPRWLAGDSVRSLAAASDGSGAVVVTASGVTRLSLEEWTLRQKAAVYESILTTRHQRHGMTNDCVIAAFGDPAASCVSQDSDNNGLWTSLVVAAEYMRYAVTGEAEALETASTFFRGLVLLNEISGKRGLVARSACDPYEKNKTCAGNGTWIHDKTKWLNSSVSKYDGWIWKSDASSDETTGHVFALSIVSQLSPNATERAQATALLTDLVGGICRHGFALIDVTGKPTTWGVWDPAHVNGQRRFSDERGLQSLQMLSYIVAALNATGPSALWTSSWAQLTNATNGYLDNLVNLKITYPEDDNYSDDLLTYLPYYTILAHCAPGTACASTHDISRIVASLETMQRITRAERSALWNAVYWSLMPSTAPQGRKQGVADMLWNLRTWPLELIEWPVTNSHRHDIVYEHIANRFGKQGTQSSHLRSPLPANERRQNRWNANPWDVSDGWDGMKEGDPGAWLLPYWMARYHGLIDEKA